MPRVTLEDKSRQPPPPSFLPLSPRALCHCRCSASAGGQAEVTRPGGSGHGSEHAWLQRGARGHRQVGTRLAGSCRSIHTSPYARKAHLPVCCKGRSSVGGAVFNFFSFFLLIIIPIWPYVHQKLNIFSCPLPTRSYSLILTLLLEVSTQVSSF